MAAPLMAFFAKWRVSQGTASACFYRFNPFYLYCDGHLAVSDGLLTVPDGLLAKLLVSSKNKREYVETKLGLFARRPQYLRNENLGVLYTCPQMDSIITS